MTTKCTVNPSPKPIQHIVLNVHQAQANTTGNHSTSPSSKYISSDKKGMGYVRMQNKGKRILTNRVASREALV
jgi:hypothetical protein